METENRPGRRKYETWGVLVEGTYVASLFPDRLVPLRSVFPMRPSDENAPLCYMLEGSLLDEPTVIELAKLLKQADSNAEKEDLATLVAYVKKGLPLSLNWFVGAGTIKPIVDNGLYNFENIAKSAATAGHATASFWEPQNYEQN